MLKLYYAPGACSTASHIGLEESGAKFDSQALAFAKNEQKTPEYLKINPRGRVPALVIDEGTIVENTAILDYVAAKYAPQLMPKDPVPRARAISLMAWFSNNVHPSFTHISRPERFATDTAVLEHLKAVGRENFHANLKEIDGLLAGKQWILGDEFWWSTATRWSSTAGASASACRWTSSRTTRRGRTACWRGRPYGACWSVSRTSWWRP